MRVSDTYSSGNFIKASDLSQPMVLTIISSSVEALKDGKTKIKLTFTETSQILLLNRTNASIIADAYGDDTDDWLNRKIKLKKGRTPFQGRMVDCINVEVSTRNGTQPAPRPQAGNYAAQKAAYSEINPPPQDDFPNDDVPF